MSILELDNLVLTYPNMKVPAVDHISLKLEHREIHALVGESGCGKSSTIRTIAGLEIPAKGEIRYRDRMLNKPGWAVAPEERQIGMVFQDYALFPHLTVKENILFGVQNKSERTAERMNHYLELTGLEGLGERYPQEISGGQMQRVALARALAPEPELILMDEPFNNLDIRIKRNMLEEVGTILRKTGTSCLFITHEKDEAFILADRISVMRSGRLLQTAPPDELYHHPVDTYVAEFFGRANHIPVKKEGDVYRSPMGDVACASLFPRTGVRPDEGYLVHRPWNVKIGENERVEVEVLDSFFFGDYQEVRFRTVEGERENSYKFFTRIDRQFCKGDTLRISLPLGELTFCRN